MSRRIQIEWLVALAAVAALILLQARPAMPLAKAASEELVVLAHEEERSVPMAMPSLPAPPPQMLGQALQARDPVELRNRLRAVRREEAPALLKALVDEREPAAQLQLAQALAGFLDDDSLRAQTVAALRPARKDVSLVALLGRGEKDAIELAADTLVNGSPEERATAAFVLNNAPASVPQRAVQAAQDALQSAGNARLREEAATLLGKAGETEPLEKLVFEAEPAVRMRAFAALADDGLDVREIADRILADANAPQRLQEMAKAWRGVHR